MIRIRKFLIVLTVVLAIAYHRAALQEAIDYGYEAGFEEGKDSPS